MSDPLKYFTKVSNEKNIAINSEAFARLMDQEDELKHIRHLFEYPKMKQLLFVDLDKVDPEEDSIYLCGNSLGLMPKGVRDTIDQMLQQWADLGVYGHHYGAHPWFISDEELVESMSRLVGASTDEVGIMNQLTSNLHFLMLSFYRPTESRFKIMCEARAFPSDHYAFESQARLHGFSPENTLITLNPRPGEHCLRTEDIIAAIHAEGPQLSLVCFSGVQYYTGQSFDIADITKAGQAVGAIVGWDLAHSVGNMELELHDWNVDFAVWATYKYLNAAAGCVGGAFVHERLLALHDPITAPENSIPCLTGWWGHDQKSRMQMTNEMIPGLGIRRYRISNPSALHSASLRASLHLFDVAGGMGPIRQKSIRLTAYFERLLQAINDSEDKPHPLLEIITPADTASRGSQLSIIFHGLTSDTMFKLLKCQGLVCDVREPNVIRVAACPLYNSFWDVFRAANIIGTILRQAKRV